MQRRDKPLEGAPDVLRQPEAAVDFKADEAVQRAPDHPGGVDRLVATQAIAAQGGEHGLHRLLARGQMPGVLGVGHALGKRVTARVGQRILTVGVGKELQRILPDRPAIAVERA